MLRLAPEADVIFSHMTPRYTVLAAPYATLFRKPQVLWYAHRHASRQLYLATACAWRVVTSMPGSYPIDTPKARMLGQGIETDFYAPAPPPKDMSMPPISPSPRVERGLGDEVVHVARLMPVKHQTTLIRALGGLPEARAVFVGGVPEGQESYREYADGLRTLAGELGVSDRVTFTGGLLAPEVRDWYRRAAVAVNLSPPGLFDKTALESMATGVPTVVCSPAFDSVLGEHAPLLRLDDPADADALAARLRALLALPPEERARIGAALREGVKREHSLDGLMPRLVRVFETGETTMQGRGTLRPP
jgi:glycosyltransferase involved in cell wall biosynthesis